MVCDIVIHIVLYYLLLEANKEIINNNMSSGHIVPFQCYDMSYYGPRIIVNMCSDRTVLHM